MNDFTGTAGELGLTPAPEADNSIQYLVVKIAGRDYGVRLANLQEVLRYNAAAVAPIPNTPDWLEGIYSLRGTIISVVNLRLFLGLASPDDSADPARRLAFDSRELFGIGTPIPRLLVLSNGELVVGGIVDELQGVLFVQPEELNGTPPQEASESFVESYYTDPKGKRTPLLDVARLLGSPQMLIFEEVVL
jgi:purine-binding chemotaxis protein CheW